MRIGTEGAKPLPRPQAVFVHHLDRPRSSRGSPSLCSTWGWSSTRARRQAVRRSSGRAWRAADARGRVRRAVVAPPIRVVLSSPNTLEANGSGLDARPPPVDAIPAHLYVPIQAAMSSKKSPARPRKTKASSSRVTSPEQREAPTKVQQTIYLLPETRKKLRLRAVEDDCDLSTVVEQALQAYLDR